MRTRELPTIANALEELGRVLSPQATETLRVLAQDRPRLNLVELGLRPAADLFSVSEQQLLGALEVPNRESKNALHPHTILILKATRLCNLRCTYCNAWREGPGQVMTLEVLARVLRDTLTMRELEALDIVWHGGEVTVLKPSFLERALWLQEYYRHDRVQVFNSIQTNATRLTDEWVMFLGDYGFSVGVSIDGPPEIHDARRLSKSGKGSWRDVKRGLDSLRAANIPFGALAVVDECVINYGAERYLEYLSNLDLRSVALLNVLPANDPDSPNRTAYLHWDRYQRFMRDLFACWWSGYRGKLVLRELQALVDAVQRGSTGLCLYADNCMGRYLTIEPDGRVSACDKYVGDPAYSFGSLQDKDLHGLMSSSENLSTAVDHVNRLKASTSTCEYYRYCKGGCPHDTRLNTTYLGNPTPGCCGLDLLIGDIIETVM